MNKPSTTEPGKLLVGPLGHGECAELPFVSYTLQDPLKHKVGCRYYNGLLRYVEDGHVYTAILDRGTALEGLGHVHLRKDGTLTYSVRTNLARMYSIPAHEQRWMGEAIPNVAQILNTHSFDIGIAQELDRLDTLLPYLLLTDDLSVRLALLKNMQCLNLLHTLVNITVYHPGRRVKSPSLVRRVVTMLKRLGLVEYDANSPTKLQYVADEMQDMVANNIWPR